MKKLNPIRVLVVDDSPVVKELVSQIINADAELEVMGEASDPYEAVKIMKLEQPDVILLDIEMPHMDGLTFLKKIMSQHPLPVVIFSGVAESGSKNAMDAIRYGAVSVLQKPKHLSGQAMKEMRIMFCDTLKGAAAAKARLRLIHEQSVSAKPFQKYTADVILAKVSAFQQSPIFSKKVILIGASTGGTQAIDFLARYLQPPLPAILIVQHMPGDFTKAFAKRLNAYSKLLVKEAENGEEVKDNAIYIANGYYHLLLTRKGSTYYLQLKDGPLVNRHKPAVDVLFRSGARYAGKNATGILLTGMGDDGARGLLELKEAGAHTIAQDKESSVVWGMPRVAWEMGAAEKLLSLQQILSAIQQIGK
jgi:two-component system chemotaxis response regulator CheB